MQHARPRSLRTLYAFHGQLKRDSAAPKVVKGLTRTNGPNLGTTAVRRQALQNESHTGADRQFHMHDTVPLPRHACACVTMCAYLSVYDVDICVADVERLAYRRGGDKAFFKAQLAARHDSRGRREGRRWGGAARRPLHRHAAAHSPPAPPAEHLQPPVLGPSRRGEPARQPQLALLYMHACYRTRYKQESCSL